MRAADTQARPGRSTALPTDLPEVADALHLRLEGPSGCPDRSSFVALPALEDLVAMLVDATQESSSTSWSAASTQLTVAGLYLYLFLSPPRPHDLPLMGLVEVSLQELAAFAAGGGPDAELDAQDAFRVSHALLIDPGARRRLWELIHREPGLLISDLDPGEPMPDHVWNRLQQTIATAAREREQADRDHTDRDHTDGDRP